MLSARLRKLAPHPGEAVAALENISCGAMPGSMIAKWAILQI